MVRSMIQEHFTIQFGAGVPGRIVTADISREESRLSQFFGVIVNYLYISKLAIFLFLLHIYISIYI